MFKNVNDKNVAVETYIMYMNNYFLTRHAKSVFLCESTEGAKINIVIG